MDQLKRDIRSVLLPAKKGLTAHELQKCYSNFVGGAIPFAAYGFITLHEMLEAITDVCQIEYHSDGIVYNAVADESTWKIKALVSKQRDKKTARIIRRRRKSPILKSVVSEPLNVRNLHNWSDQSASIASFQNNLQQRQIWVNQNICNTQPETCFQKSNTSAQLQDHSMKIVNSAGYQSQNTANDLLSRVTTSLTTNSDKTRADVVKNPNHIDPCVDGVKCDFQTNKNNVLLSILSEFPCGIKLCRLKIRIEAKTRNKYCYKNIEELRTHLQCLSKYAYVESHTGKAYLLNNKKETTINAGKRLPSEVDSVIDGMIDKLRDLRSEWDKEEYSVISDIQDMKRSHRDLKPHDVENVLARSREIIYKGTREKWRDLGELISLVKICDAAKIDFEADVNLPEHIQLIAQRMTIVLLAISNSWRFVCKNINPNRLPNKRSNTKNVPHAFTRNRQIAGNRV